jgi:hypothetical protein
LNSKESFDESTATSSSVRLSGARRVKEIAERLDIQEYRTDPGNSDRGNICSSGNRGWRQRRYSVVIYGEFVRNHNDLWPANVIHVDVGSIFRIDIR